MPSARTALLLTLLIAAPAAAAPVTEPVSLTPDGAVGNKRSVFSSISADGNWIAFSSKASDLVPGDLNRTYDVFLRNMDTGRTVLASGTPAGGQFKGRSEDPTISADGRFVSFTSSVGVYLYNRKTKRTTVVAKDERGGGFSTAPAVSGDGRYVVFESNRNLVEGDKDDDSDIIRWTRASSTYELVSRAAKPSDGSSESPEVSANGRYVAFTTEATNLVPDDTDDADIVLKDMQTGAIERVSVDDAGTAASDFIDSEIAISGDGRRVAFGTTAPLVAGGGRSVTQLYLRDLDAGTTVRVSNSENGKPATDDSSRPAFSGDGRYLAFDTTARLVASDSGNNQDVYVTDLEAGGIQRLSLSSGGQGGPGDSAGPSLSGDGRYVSFATNVGKLVKSDTNRVADIVRRGPLF